jgi:hypothetical protein
VATGNRLGSGGSDIFALIRAAYLAGRGDTLNALTTTRRVEAAHRSYLRSTFAPRRAQWRDAYEAALERDIELARGPYLQATPPFAIGASPEDLIREGVLSPGFRRLDPAVFPIERGLYVHQEQAVRAALAGRNLLVATGTGSGKTECVLIPALEELLAEGAAGTLAAPGVRVLLLYPMNALANDQVRRFRGWLRAFPEITFGRYVGDTKETRARAIEAFEAIHPGEAPLGNELLSREEMRVAPPHILVTNYSMLEYLLLRPVDTAFFDGVTGSHWRTVALDEAHVYDGADGAEVAMLLRRLRDRATGSRRGALRVVATSATLGKGKADYPELIRFGEDLFDEPFELRDVIGPVHLNLARRPSTSELPMSAYHDLAEALRAEEAAGTPPTVEAVALALEPHDPGLGQAIRAAADAGRALHDVLAEDRWLVALQAALDAEGTLTLAEVAERVFGDPGRVADVVDLVDLGVRARETPADAPLLPARYHYWLRGLEGAFVCLHPDHPAGAPVLRLSVFERCPSCAEIGVTSAMVELGICKRCRADYAIGIGDLGRELRRAPVGQSPTAYLLLDGAAADADEDEVEDEGAAAGAPGVAAWYCPGCGWLLEEAGSPCGCAGTPPPRRSGSLVLVSGEDARMRRCASCASGVPGGSVVGRFLTDAHAPAAVIGTALYQELPVASDPRAITKSGEGRKLLAFADSRQDAAFFAPYFDRTYGRALTRSLLLRVVEAHASGEGLRPDDLVAPLLDAGDRFLLLNRRDSPATRRRVVLTWVLGELLATDRRQSLDGVGVLRIGPAMPPDVPTSLAPLGLPASVARDLATLLLDSLRISGVLRLPSGVARNDAAFEPRNIDYAVRGTGAERSKLVLAWAPDRSNRRRELLVKVAAAAGVTVDPTAILRDLWVEMTVAGSPWETLLPFENDRRRGLVRWLDAASVELRPAAESGPRYRCDRCRALWWQNVLAVCPGYNCGGRLAPVAPDEPLGHYADLYRRLEPIPMRAKEHTAQWSMDKGTDIQQRFLDGDINVLSCSTTFELGVDVGDVEAVLLRNVPPTAANYVQRAGRAGRRTSGAAVVVTLAQRRNHDIAWFRDPRAMVGGSVAPPRIVTENPIIARRHAHSVALAASLRREELRTVGDFFETLAQDGTTGIERFLAWLRSRPADLGLALGRILPPATARAIGLADWDWVEALMTPSDDDPSSGWLARAAAEVTAELTALETLIVDAAARRDFGIARVLEYQVRTLRGGRLIEFLARRNVLPKYGFPVDVVELDLTRTQDQDAAGVELNRDLRIAISEYAPGAELVAGGVVWRSVGLKRLPDWGWPEHGWAVCRDCGRYREARAADASETCGVCGSPDTSASGSRIRPVFGFYGVRSSTVIGDEPVLRRGTVRSWFTDYGPGDPPVAASPADLAPGAVETFVSRQGRIVTMNLGPGGRGFRICSCGYGSAVPLTRARGTRAEHQTPYSGRSCHGTLRVTQLSTDFLTDILEARIRATHTEPALRSALYALLEGASDLGIKRDELDGTIHAWSRDARSLVLYDTVPGGAGHAARIQDGFGRVVRAAVARVEGCDCGIETSCYGCLRGYTNQFWHEDLTRAGALRVLLPLLGRAVEEPSPLTLAAAGPAS